MIVDNKLKTDNSILCPYCDSNYFLLNKKEINETTTETLCTDIHNYADTRVTLTCCSCGNIFKIINL